MLTLTLSLRGSCWGLEMLVLLSLTRGQAGAWNTLTGPARYPPRRHMLQGAATQATGFHRSIGRAAPRSPRARPQSRHVHFQRLPARSRHKAYTAQHPESARLGGFHPLRQPRWSVVTQRQLPIPRVGAPAARDVAARVAAAARVRKRDGWSVASWRRQRLRSVDVHPLGVKLLLGRGGVSGLQHIDGVDREPDRSAGSSWGAVSVCWGR